MSVTAASAAGPPALAAIPARTRHESVDFLRGLVMVLMALDHVRDHLHLNAFFIDPTDLATTTPATFMTRWVTHFCAPVFVFLAGTSAFLTGTRRTRGDLSRFLLTRGLWLVLLEITIIHVEWTMSWNPAQLFAQVIWALGWSMVVLAALVWLPLPAIAAFGWGMIVLHNLADGMQLGWLWSVLHISGPTMLFGKAPFMIMYPLVPWIGVMAAGYAFGAWLQRHAHERRRLIMGLGLGLTAAFVVIRAINLYGDPHPWAPQKDAVFTVLSFLRCEKYPPSLLFLLMTLGPSLILLAAVDRGVPRLLRWMTVFGRVPLFYYMVHLALIDLLTVGLAIASFGPRTPEIFAKGPPRDWGYGLPVVYAAWVAVVAALYPVCRWYAGVRPRSRLLSHL
ncbi:MAG TPA: heparan-alpha-glucosaminide N-acetyltransferase domain-containing protein [Candidatus Eisenbacteria bacterium]|nr:heparan-alpha-glucosaminide N-acetyltransferase domain-containing protein [Candidatus Eisenbacteria bacterium]